MTKTVFWAMLSIMVMLVGAIGMIAQGLETGDSLEFVTGGYILAAIIIFIYDTLFGTEEEEVY